MSATALPQKNRTQFRSTSTLRSPFTTIPNAILFNPNLKPGPSKVLDYLMSCAWYDATICFPAIKTIAKHCNISERSARRYVRTLEKKEVINIIYREGTSNLYLLKCKEQYIVPPASPIEPSTHENPPKIIKPPVPQDTAQLPPIPVILPDKCIPRPICQGGAANLTAKKIQTKKSEKNNSNPHIENHPQSVQAADPNDLLKTVVVSLGIIGIRKAAAQKLIRKHGPEKVQEQLEALKYRDAHNPAGLLVKALDEDYSLPTKLIEEQKQKELQAKAQAKKVAQIKAEQEHAEKVKKETELLEAIPHLIPAEQLEEITREATENLAVKKILPGRPGFVMSLKFEVLRIVREKGMIDENHITEMLAKAVT